MLISAFSTLILGLICAWIGWPKYRLRNLLRIEPKIETKDRFAVYNETQRTLIQVLGVASLAGTFYFSSRSIDTATEQLRLARLMFKETQDRQERQVQEQIQIARFTANENARLAKRRLVYERKIDALKAYNRVAGGSTDIFLKCLRLRIQVDRFLSEQRIETSALEQFGRDYVVVFGDYTSWMLTHSIEASVLTTVSGRNAPRVARDWFQSPTDFEQIGAVRDPATLKLQLTALRRQLQKVLDGLPKLGEETAVFIQGCYRDFQHEADQN